MLVQSKHLALLLFFSSLTDIVFVLGTCNPACVSCTNCVTCAVGSYLESGSCLPCPAHCTSCNNSMVCYNCTEGYYELSCEKNCISSMCLNNTCDKHSGACLHGCIEGYYLYGLSCYQCGANCKTCANFSNNCLECKDGYYGPSCQHQCSHCKDSICNRDNCTYGCGDGFFRGTEACNPCNEHCTSCSHYNNCQVCENGYFGPACQFNCSDCSPCNQNGSCHPAPITTTQPISSTKELVTTSFPTTTISTTSRPSTSTTQRSGTSKQSVSTFFPTTTTSTTMTITSQDSASISGVFPTSSSQPLTNMEPNSKDNTLIIYATAGGGGGLVVIILAIVVVCKRRRRAKQSDNGAESIDMTENENYISADDINNLTRNSSNARKEVKQNEQKNNDALYSQPNKMHHPTMVSRQTISTETTEGSPSNISPTIPAKNNVYSDLM